VSEQAQARVAKLKGGGGGNRSGSSKAALASTSKGILMALRRWGKEDVVAALRTPRVKVAVFFGVLCLVFVLVSMSNNNNSRTSTPSYASPYFRQSAFDRAVDGWNRFVKSIRLYRFEKIR